MSKKTVNFQLSEEKKKAFKEECGNMANTIKSMVLAYLDNPDKMRRLIKEVKNK